MALVREPHGTPFNLTDRVETEEREGGRTLSQSRKSAKRRDAVIRTAIGIINAKSFALATMSEIAASLDLRDAALYYYFEDKQALGYACHVQSLQRLQTVLDAADQGGGPGLTKVGSFIQGMLEDAADNGPQLYLGDYSYLNAAQRVIVGEWVDRLKARVEGFLKDGMADGTVVRCETGLVVQLLLGMLIWLAKWTPDVGDLTVDRLMAAISAFSFHGLESRTGTADSPSQATRRPGD